MARPERAVDPRSGPLALFAHDLRQLRRQAGLPSYRVLAGSTHFSATALSKAASGRQLPSLDVTLAYVRACGGEPTSWRRRWQDLCAATAPPPGPEPEPPARDGADPYAQRCGADQQELERQPIAWPDGGRYGWLVLFHSRARAASWGYVYGPNSPSWRVSITARRATDGATAPSTFRGDAAPNSWGNVLSTRPGAVRVEAWVDAGPDSRPDPGPRTETAYWQP